MTIPLGTRVRVKNDWPEAGPQRVHVRTPHFVRGREGRVVAVLGDFPNPEKLAFGRPAEKRRLYQVSFDQPSLWRQGQPGDTLTVDLYEHWLEPL